MSGVKISDLSTISPLSTDLVVLDRPSTGAGAPVTGKATLADVQSLFGGGGATGAYWSEKSLNLIHTTGSVEITGSLSQGGPGNITTGNYSHAEGLTNTASGDYSHAEGGNTLASGHESHAEGGSTIASGFVSHAEGYNNTTASGFGSHAEGSGTTASSDASHSEGNSTTASGAYSHAEGESTQAAGYTSHAEGYFAVTAGSYSHAEGSYTTAEGNYSHAEGIYTFAIGEGSHSEGIGTIASGSWQNAKGKYNVRNNDFSIFVIGDGTGDLDVDRSDILRVNSGSAPGNGRVEVTGSLDVTVGMTGSLSYTPGNGSHWADPDPTNVKDALDRIAALLYTLNSNTEIP